jgi:GAF domain-containing protein
MNDIAELTVDRNLELQESENNGGSLERTSESFVRALSDSETQALLQAPYRGATASESITELASMAATLLRAEGCMIMLLKIKDDNRTALGPYSCACPAAAQACEEWADAGEVIARKAISAGKSLLSEHRAMRPGTVAADLTFSGTRAIIATPIRVNGDVVGVMSLISRVEAQRFGPDEVAFADIVAWFIGQALNAVRLRSVLSSAFAQRAIAQEAQERLGEAVSISGKQPQQLGRILAKSFYREMVKVGLDSGQIIDAASEIISELSGNLKKHAARRQAHEGSAVNSKLNTANTKLNRASNPLPPTGA